MKQNGFRLIAMTMLGSMVMAAIVLRLGGGLLLAFAVYSLGGAGLMALLAGIMVWRIAQKVELVGADLKEWESDHALEKSEAPKPEQKRRSG